MDKRFWHVSISLAIVVVTVLGIPSHDGPSNYTKNDFVVVRLTQHQVCHEILACVCVCVCVCVLWSSFVLLLNPPAIFFFY
jgi:hypothetical protein